MPQDNEEEGKKNKTISSDSIPPSTETMSSKQSDFSQTQNDFTPKSNHDFEDTRKQIDALLNNDQSTGDAPKPQKQPTSNGFGSENQNSPDPLTKNPQESDIHTQDTAKETQPTKPKNQDNMKPRVTITDSNESWNKKPAVQPISDTPKPSTKPKEEVFEIQQSHKTNEKIMTKKHPDDTKKKLFSFPKIRLNLKRSKEEKTEENKQNHGFFSAKKPLKNQFQKKKGQQEMDSLRQQETKTTTKPSDQEGQQKQKKKFSLFSKDKSKQTKKKSLIKTKKLKDKTSQPNQSSAQQNKQNTLISPIPPQTTSHSTQSTNDQTMDEDIKKVLLMTDELLAKLPEDVIEDFASSEDFALYQKVMNKYNVK